MTDQIKRRVGRPLTLPDVWGRLATSVGGVDVLSRLIRKSPRQIRRMARRQNKVMPSVRPRVLRVAENNNLLEEYLAWENAHA